MKKTAAKGHTSKHATTKSKHKATSKHTPAKTVSSVSGAGKTKVSAVAKPAVHAKAVGLALGEGVACCAAEALAASLRLQGVRVGDEDVLGLYWHTASDPDAGASILATLEAAWRFGLGGVRPASIRPVGPDEILASLLTCGDEIRDSCNRRSEVGPEIGLAGPLILGVELPGPHAVLADADGWWSWGELHDPAEWPDAVVESAWAVTWA